MSRNNSTKKLVNKKKTQTPLLSRGTSQSRLNINSILNAVTENKNRAGKKNH